MSLAEKFENFCMNLQITDEEYEKWKFRIERINKKLNMKYYSEDNVNNTIIVGSVGRGTAIKGGSDWDCIYILPNSIYSKFENYKYNGQSALLQEIKEEIKSIYPKTKIKGDGQVVTIEFSDGGKIELVPGFKQFDGSFKYPNTNNNGKWKFTNPIPEIKESIKTTELTDKHYKYLCQIVRKWKNNVGFKFKGLLIDSLVKEYLKKECSVSRINFEKYPIIISELFKYLSEHKNDRKHWYALGSNQIITNDDYGKFIKKAKYANQLLIDKKSKFPQVYVDLFGKDFLEEKERNLISSKNEMFIEDMFLVDIRYNIKLECNITQKGFRESTLGLFLSNKWKLRKDKELTFFILKDNIEEEVKDGIEWYWKVRNIGYEAIVRNMERGEIRKGKNRWKEVTSFTGEHYVECYAVYHNIVVARDKISVPIDIGIGHCLEK